MDKDPRDPPLPDPNQATKGPILHQSQQKFGLKLGEESSPNWLFQSPLLRQEMWATSSFAGPIFHF